MQTAFGWQVRLRCGDFCQALSPACGGPEAHWDCAMPRIEAGTIGGRDRCVCVCVPCTSTSASQGEVGGSNAARPSSTPSTLDGDAHAQIADEAYKQSAPRNQCGVNQLVRHHGAYHSVPDSVLSYGKGPANQRPPLILEDIHARAQVLQPCMDHTAHQLRIGVIKLRSFTNAFFSAGGLSLGGRS